VPLDLPELHAARENHVAICSELDLVAHVVDDRVIGITGSNGKSTSTALAAAMLGAAGHDGVPCGNFGLPLCDAVQGDHPGRWYALELSSFQLDITSRLTASAAVLLNVQADHLDRHGDIHAYRAAKEKIAALRRPGAPLVLAVDDPLVADFAHRAGGPVLSVSADHEVASGGFVRDGRLTLRLGGNEETLIDAAQLAIPGRHNRVNALAAAVACRAVGVPADALRRALTTFRALPHRIQEIALVGGVRYVDDSKATNVGSVLEAIRALRERTDEGRRIFVLLGGRDKGSDFGPLAAALTGGGASAITFGEAGPLIAAALERGGVTPCARVCTLEDAVAAAHAAAVPGDTVLLSPACASFDAFTSYAHRGDVFAAAARALAGGTGAGNRN
jgi:UDP-N-acetylmuramoylalanine--D-glutamate ligase